MATATERMRALRERERRDFAWSRHTSASAWGFKGCGAGAEDAAADSC
jgi:hypothetical protein